MPLDNVSGTQLSELFSDIPLLLCSLGLSVLPFVHASHHYRCVAQGKSHPHQNIMALMEPLIDQLTSMALTERTITGAAKVQY